jgi:two-component system chemotaxis response regulator CheY
MAIILLIDDANTIRNVCAQILKQASHEVRTAASAEAGIQEIVDFGVPNLIITDIDMPGMDGLELCERIRQTGATVPILVITSYSDKEMILKARALNLAGWLLKPVTPESLIQKVNEALGSSGHVTN